MSAERISRWVKVVLAVSGLVALGIFRSPWVAWFMPTPEAVSGPTVMEATSEEGARPMPSYTFTAESLSALQQAFDNYDVIRDQLARDQVEAIPGASRELASHLLRVREDAGASLPSEVTQVLRRTEGAIGRLEVCVDAESARAPFGELSRGLFQLANSDSRLREGWRAFACPMASGFQKWFQRSETLANPYMGQRMLACGGSTEWRVDGPGFVSNADAVAYYTCAMHPSVREHAAGTCPICRMDLTPVTEGEMQSGAVRVDPLRRQRIGVRTAVVTRRALSRTIRAVGRVTWDETTVHDVTSRVHGWVEELRVRRVGDPVVRGTALLRLYSPELFATQRELLAAPSGSRLATSARERLRLSGMSRAEIQEVLRRRTPRERVLIRSEATGVVIEKRINDGSHVQMGDLLLRIADPSRVWVLADIFEADLPFVREGQSVRLAFPQSSAVMRTGEVAYLYPALDPVARTGQVRIELANDEGQLRPEMLTQLRFEVALGEHLSVPHEAIVFTGLRRIVFVDEGEGRLVPRDVQLGPRAGEWTAIRSGLSEGDRVVQSGAFLIAAESRIQSATGYWSDTYDAR